MQSLNLTKIKEALAKKASANPKAPGILAALARIQAVVQEDASSNAAISSSGPEGQSRLINSVTVKVLLLEMEQKENKKKNQFGGSNVHTEYVFYVLSVGTQPINKSDGRRIDDTTIELNIECDQRMNPQELAAFRAKLTADGVPEANAQWKQLKKKFRLGTKTISQGEKYYLTVFQPPFKDGASVLGPGSVVLLRGIRPTQSYKVSEETGALGEPDYGVKWEISQMVRDGASRNIDFSQIWRTEMEKNHFVHISARHDFGEHNMSAEERTLYETSAQQGRMDNMKKWRAAYAQVPPAVRGHINSLFIVPVGSANPSLQPFHLANRQAVLVRPVQWDKEWVAIEDKMGAQKKKLRKGSFSAEVQLYTEGSAHEKVVIYGRMSEATLKEKFNKFGLVDPERWEQLGGLLMDGWLVMKLDLMSTKDLRENDPIVNGLREDGTYELGFSGGAVYNTDIIEPNVAKAVVDNSYEINGACAKALMRAAFGTDDLSLNPNSDAVANSKKNLLRELPGGQPIINLMEDSKSVSSLVTEGYKLFVLYRVNRAQMDKWLLRIEGDTPEAKFAEFNRLMMEDDDRFLGFPKPNYNDKNSFCVFAIRSTEVDKLRAPPAQLTEEQFAQSVLDLMATAEKREQQAAAQMRLNLEAPLPQHNDAPLPPPVGDAAPPPPPVVEQQQGMPSDLNKVGDGAEDDIPATPPPQPKKSSKTRHPAPAKQKIVKRGKHAKPTHSPQLSSAVEEDEVVQDDIDI